MLKQDHFPIELLSQPIKQRWQYFSRKIVAHPRLVEIHQELQHAIHYAVRGRLILVFGPTGVGKTTLRLGIERHFIETLEAELAQDPGRIPITSLEAASPELGHFDWKDFYTRALINLNEPLIQAKLPPDHAFDIGLPEVRCREDGQVVIQAGLTVRKLRRALESCLRYRRPVAFIIDEAQHLQKIAGGRRLRDQMDAIKSMADRSDTVHVLIGTYELLNLTNLSDQLSRRSQHIPFSRYRAEDEADQAAFKRVVQTFQQHLPLPKMPDLVKQLEYLYEHSAGCVGILKIWLSDALAAAMENGEPTLTVKRLQRQAMPPDQLMNIIRELLEGERRLAAIEEQRPQIRQALGLPATSAVRPPVKTTPAKRQSQRVGERVPVRDPIGRRQHDE